MPRLRRLPLAAPVVAACLVLTPVLAASQPAPTGQPAGRPTRLDDFVDRVWVVAASATVTPGALYVFLSDNVLVVSSRGGPPSVGSWAETAEGLVITEGGVRHAVEILELNADRFRIRIDNAGAPAEITFAPAGRPRRSGTAGTGDVGPLPTMYRCGAETYGVAFQSGKAYITLPDSTVITMGEVKVPDAPASRRTFSDGSRTFVEDTSEAYTRVLFARAGFRPRPCTSMR